MKVIFKLAVVTIVQEKLAVLVLFLGAILPYALAEMTNYEINEIVLEPARAQVAWQFMWLASFFWLLFQASKLGGEHAASGMGAYFSSQGVSKGSQLTALWGSVFVVSLLMGLVAVVVTLCGSMPNDEKEALHWGVLTVQHYVFYAIVAGSLLMLAVALASRFGVAAGYVFTIGIALTSFYGVSILGKVVLARDFIPLDLLYVCLPHFYLGDLTHRFVHKQGALSAVEFFGVFEYLAGWALLLAMVSGFVFSPKQK